MELETLIRDRGGVIATWELHQAGYGRARITDLVASRGLLRVRQGWYCSPSLPHDAQRAVRVGGQLTCSSGARFWGLWVPRGDDALHVGVQAGASRLRKATSYRTRLGDEPTVKVHWTGTSPARSRVVAPPSECLRQIAHCHSPEYLAVVAESALHTGLITEDDWAVIRESLPRTFRRRLPDVGRSSASGIESLFVFRIRALGIQVAQQVRIDGVGIVDALIGDSLIVELDGEAFHRDDARDRRRDAAASARGYRTLRFLANQIEREWESVEAAVVAAIARGDHQAPPVGLRA